MTLKESLERLDEKHDTIRDETGADGVSTRWGDEWKEVTLSFGDVPNRRGIVVEGDEFPTATDEQTGLVGSGETVGEALIELGHRLHVEGRSGANQE